MGGSKAAKKLVVGSCNARGGCFSSTTASRHIHSKALYLYNNVVLTVGVQKLPSSAQLCTSATPARPD
ncbi:hypothetical protein M0R45_026435 [Rubus argutus]|uniref:Uncharacterized protein n=1 Tax=Rubus argutus TaxID=59490 RepID=A0AAW1WXJ4_RUBAR